MGGIIRVSRDAASVPEASEKLRELAARGRRIRAELLGLRESKRSAKGRVSAAVDVLDYFVDLTGYKRAARRLGNVYTRSQLTEREATLTQDFDEWVQSVRASLSMMSTVKPGLGLEGNSEILLRKFSKTQSFVKPETNLSHGVAFLEELADARIVWNDDLPSVLQQSRVAPEEEAEPSLDSLGEHLLSPDERQKLTSLSVVPDELESIKGALAVYHAAGPDSGRQALSSCRNALENLVKRLSGEGEFRAGLRKIVSSDTRRRTIGQVYSYLSAYGVHSKEPPSDTDVELGIRLTISAVLSLLEWSRG